MTTLLQTAHKTSEDKTSYFIYLFIYYYMLLLYAVGNVFHFFNYINSNKISLVFTDKYLCKYLTHCCQLVH